MKFKDVVAISGMGGLYEMVKQRPNGMLVRPLGGTKTQLVSNRIHTFSPLDKISIYTSNDTVELKEVMRTIFKADIEEGKPPIAHKSGSSELKRYFRTILEDYDEERVYVSDIKKVIKWYNLLKEHDIINLEDEPEEGEEEE